MRPFFTEGLRDGPPFRRVLSRLWGLMEWVPESNLRLAVVGAEP